MSVIYQVTVHGRKLESRDLHKLLARAVAEKRSMDLRLRLNRSLPRGSSLPSWTGMACASEMPSR